MNTRLPSINPKLSSLVAVLGALWCLVINPLKAENIVGDTVLTNLTVQGNALIAGNLEAQGFEFKLGQNGANPGISMNFVPASGSDPSEVQFLQSEHVNKGEWVWALKPSTGADKVQMVLGADNFLSLYATNYSSGAPNAGKIVISPRTSGSSISIDGSVVLTEAVGDSRYLTQGDADVTYMTQTTADGLYVSSDNFSAAVVTLEDEFGSTTGPTIALSEGIATAPYSFAGLSAHATGVYSTAAGYLSNASGRSSTATGMYSTASGEGSTATGFASTASGICSTATGYGTTASEIYSSATGYSSIASGPYSTASGPYSIASGDSTISAGNHTTATGAFQFVIGSYNIAQGDPSYWVPTDDLFVIGNGVDDYTRSNALVVRKNGETALYSTVDPANPVIVLDPNNSQITINGEQVLTGSMELPYLTSTSADDQYLRKDATTISLGTGNTAANNAIAIGINSEATGSSSIAIGEQNYAQGQNSTAFGRFSAAVGAVSTAFGDSNIAQGVNSTAFGGGNSATGEFSTVFGGSNSASGAFSTVFGTGNTASGDSSMAFGYSTIAGGYLATAFGQMTTASSQNSTAFGYMTIASGDSSTAFGAATTAEGAYSTAFGLYTTAVGESSTAFGSSASAGGVASAAFGEYTVASGHASVALGYSSNASGDASAALGTYTQAQAYSSIALGYMNVAQGNANAWVPTDDLVVVGNGEYTSVWNPSNAFAIHKNGNTRIAGQLEAKGVIRCAKAGDLDMGVFTDGANPADATNGLNAGLRYATE